MFRLALFTLFFATPLLAQLSGMRAELQQSNEALTAAREKLTASVKASGRKPDRIKAQLEKLAKAQKAWEAWLKLETDASSDLLGEGSSTLAIEESILLTITLNDQRTKHLLELAGEDVTPATNAKLIQPQRGNPLRKTLCNALRPSIEKDLGVKKPIFVIHSMRVIGDWAFIHSSPRTAKGGEINWSKTKYREEFEFGSDDLAVALLKKAPSGQWKVETFGIGGTDVWWLEWKGKYNLPNNLLHDE